MSADSVNDLLGRLEQLNTVGAALSRERDITQLLENILVAAKSITHADGGTIYLISDDRRTLCIEILRTDSLHLAMGGSSGGAISLPDLPLFDAQGLPNDSLVASYAAIHKQTVNVADAYSEANFDFSGTRGFDERTGYRSCSFLTVPMKSHDDEVIGVLQLINARASAGGEVVAFSTADQSLVESLASQASIALSNRLLITQLEALFVSFINMINLAIDEKSHHTGAHCQRVPELTMMLAEAAHQTTHGPLASFVMDDQDRHELKIASLLHDCGKVTTPVHVADKATKLQTIYDRIGLIDTRFEVLKRDEELLALRLQLALRPVTDARAEAELQAACRSSMETLNQEREFLRLANVGAEAMLQEDMQRVRDIGERHSWRNVEGVQSGFLTAEEIENLTIRSGTLNQRERDTINYHIVATIKMLEQLPWPRHLRHVPEYAGGHHERMDGKGYPRGLTREQMSIQARIMGIADVFEALTARDRPYKPGMKLSQAMAIMHKFKRNGHLDPDLFDIFVEQRLYQRYGEKFLEPEQIDAVHPQDWR